MPAASDCDATVTVNCAGVTPLVGETVSQLPPVEVVAEAVKDVPLPDEDTEAVWAEGDGWPATAEKVRVAGVTERVCADWTVRATLIVIGLPCAPGELIITVPV